MVHRVAQSQTQLKRLSTHIHTLRVQSLRWSYWEDLAI